MSLQYRRVLTTMDLSKNVYIQMCVHIHVHINAHTYCSSL